MTAWKDLERRVAKALGGTRTGPQGKALSDIQGIPFSVECKYTKGGVPERHMIDQAIQQGRLEGKPWLLVVARHNDRQPTVTLEFLALVQILRRAGMAPVATLIAQRGETRCHAAEQLKQKP